MLVRIEALEPRQLLNAAAPTAVGPVPNVTASVDALVFSEVRGEKSRPVPIRVFNRGDAPLTIQSVSLVGDGANDFEMKRRRPSVTLRPRASARFRVMFAPGEAAVSTAALQVVSNDPDAPVFTIALSGLGTAGHFDKLEPSLQRILDVFRIPVNAGDPYPDTNGINYPEYGNTPLGDEVAMPLLKKAGPGPVQVSVLAAYSWDWKPAVAKIGWYDPSRPRALKKVMTVRPGNAQQVLPATAGRGTFDPGNTVFGLFGLWPSEKHGPAFSWDAWNTWDVSDDRQHKVRFYPYKTPDGQVVPNSYVVAMEQAFNSDYQDTVVLIQNVAPAD